MAIKVLIKRRFKEGYFNEINNMLKKVRYGAMDQKGYISSETMWDHEDPFRVLVVSTWQSIEDWNNWKNSDLRKSNEEKFEECLDGSTEFEVFDIGIYPH